MKSTKRLCLASIIALTFGFYMPAYAEDDLTAKEFLEWSDQGKRSYIQISLMMANMIAVENDQKQSDCIGHWYGSNPRGKEQFIYGAMEKYPSYHPIGIIMAVIEKQCGSFKYR